MLHNHEYTAAIYVQAAQRLLTLCPNSCQPALYQRREQAAARLMKCAADPTNDENKARLDTYDFLAYGRL